MSGEALLNGQFVPYDEAAVAINNRGFQFSEGVYEMIATYRGRPFELDRHLRRLRVSAGFLGIDIEPVLEDLVPKSQELLRRSGLQEALIYLQVTTGAAPRTHLRPEGLVPTVVATVSPNTPVPERYRKQGMSAITVPDERWARCYIKTTMLLPNTIAKRRAVSLGCDDAVFIRDGFLTEATAANVFAVFDGVIMTPPKSNYILHGVTREVVLELAEELGIPRVEGPVPAEKLPTADEIFFSGTTFEVAAVTSLDGKKIGSGLPGPVVGRLLDAFKRRTLAE